jgi:hypothetical protein
MNMNQIAHRQYREAFTAVLSLVILLSGCSSKELSRSKAASLIKESDNFKTPVTIKLTTNPSAWVGISASLNEEQAREQYLKKCYEGDRQLGTRTAKQLGLINESIENAETSNQVNLFGGILGTPPSRFKHTLTANEKGKKLWLDYRIDPKTQADDTLPNATKSFGEVTGIAKIGNDENKVNVEFTWGWTPNELGTAMRIKQESNKRGVASFQRYDDGWRLINIQYQ